MKNDSKKLRNCKQKKCGFMMMGFGCRTCEECNTEPYLVHEDCVSCWNCENDEGILRWNDNKQDVEEKQLQVVKIQ